MRTLSTISRILRLLEDGQPRSIRQIAKELGFSYKPICNAVLRYYNKGLLARTKDRISEADQQFRGRAGKSRNTRHYYLYTLPQYINHRFQLKPEQKVQRFNKSEAIRQFILSNNDQAFFSREIFDKLQEQHKEIKFHISEIITTARKMEKKRLVYIRGYLNPEKQTPFKEGFLLTALDQDKPITEALEEAIQRTEKRLQNGAAENPIIHRTHRIRDAILANSLRREITGKFYLDNLLDISPDALNYAIDKCLELYPNIKKIKIFNRFIFFYDEKVLSEEDLQAQIKFKQNWIRKAAGRYNRLGHNWEAIVGWFVDKFTPGVTFWSQDHRRRAPLDPLISRRGMHPRRITLHLIKNVGDRKNRAEVDRVWEVTPTMFSESPTIFVLEAKWSLITKRTLDDFFEVLRWSKEFGADSQSGRVIKSGVVPIFAASSFSHDSVKLGDKLISIAEYAARLNIEIWTQARFNDMLHKRGVPVEITVQKVCRAAANEDEVAKMLDSLWDNPSAAEEILKSYLLKNVELFKLENEMNPPKEQKKIEE